KFDVEQEIPADAARLDSSQDLVLDTCRLDVQHQETVSVVIEPVVEILPPDERIVMEDDAAAALPEVDFGAVLVRDVFQPGDAVDAMYDDIHLSADVPLFPAGAQQ